MTAVDQYYLKNEVDHKLKDNDERNRSEHLRKN